MVPKTATRLTELLAPYAPADVIQRVMEIIDEHEDCLIGDDEHYHGPSSDHEDVLRIRNKLRLRQRHHKLHATVAMR